MKPGAKTTEFYLSLAAMAGVVALALTGNSDPETIGALTGLAGIYSAGRSYVKGKGE